MNKRQLCAISYNHTKLRLKRQVEFLTAINRFRDFILSKYKTPTRYIKYNNLNQEYYDYCKKNNLKVYQEKIKGVKDLWIIQQNTTKI